MTFLVDNSWIIYEDVTCLPLLGDKGLQTPYIIGLVRWVSSSEVKPKVVLETILLCTVPQK